MDTKSNDCRIVISADPEELLNHIGEDFVIGWITKKGYEIIEPSEQSKYVNIDKSMGTEAFYNLITNAVEEGKLSLEMIVGHILTKRLMKTAEKVFDKPQVISEKSS